MAMIPAAKPSALAMAMIPAAKQSALTMPLNIPLAMIPATIPGLQDRLIVMLAEARVG